MITAKSPVKYLRRRIYAINFDSSRPGDGFLTLNLIGDGVVLRSIGIPETGSYHWQAPPELIATKGFPLAFTFDGPKGARANLTLSCFDIYVDREIEVVESHTFAVKPLRRGEKATRSLINAAHVGDIAVVEKYKA